MSECYVSNMSLFDLGVVWFFLSKANLIPFFCFLSRKCKHLVILEMYGPQFENSIEVWTFFFLHTTFSMKETLYMYWYCGQSWKQTCPYCEYPFSCLCWGPYTFRKRSWSDVEAGGWRSQGAPLPTCCFPEDTWGVYAQGASASETSGVLAAGYPGSDIHFEKVLIWPSVPRLPSTHLFLLTYVSASFSLLLVLVKSSNWAKVKRIELV